MPDIPSQAEGSRAPLEQISEWAKKYRGATVEDLDPPPAMSTSPNAKISQALVTAFERDYTHLTVLTDEKALVGYLSIPHLRTLLERGQVAETDPVQNAMLKFRRKGKRYQVITLETPLEELEAFFEGGTTRVDAGRDGDRGGPKQEFAVVTDPSRRFVIGVATRDDLAEFVRRRPA